MGKIPVGIRLTKSLIARLKAVAKARHEPMAAIIDEGIETAVKKRERKADAR